MKLNFHSIIEMATKIEPHELQTTEAEGDVMQQFPHVTALNVSPFLESREVVSLASTCKQLNDIISRLRHVVLGP